MTTQCLVTSITWDFGTQEATPSLARGYTWSLELRLSCLRERELKDLGSYKHLQLLYLLKDIFGKWKSAYVVYNYIYIYYCIVYNTYIYITLYNILFFLVAIINKSHVSDVLLVVSTRNLRPCCQGAWQHSSTCDDLTSTDWSSSCEARSSAKNREMEEQTNFKWHRLYGKSM